MEAYNLKDISKKLDELISAHQIVKHENKKLIENEKAWQNDRQRLLQQNELARNKIAEMIARLRNLEREPQE